MEPRQRIRGSVPLFGAPNPSPAEPRKRPSDDRKAPDVPSPKTPSQGSKSKRYNLTVRLSPDERETLETIGRTEGKPDPMGLAQTVRWLISRWPH